MSALAWFLPDPASKPTPASPPAAGEAGWHRSRHRPSMGSGPGGPERRAGLSGTSKLAEARGPGWRAGWETCGAQAPCLGRAPLPGRPRGGFRRAAGSSVVALGNSSPEGTQPSPSSGNLSIREIDNPQRRAAHSLRSPALGSPAQGGATAQGRRGGAGGKCRVP